MAPRRRRAGLRLRALGLCGWAASLASAPAWASTPTVPPECPCVPLEVVVRRAGTREPLDDAAVYVLSAPPDARPGRLRRLPPAEDAPRWQREAQTGAGGRLRLDAVPVGMVHWVVAAPGLGRYDEYVRIGPAQRRLQLFVHPRGEEAYRTVVRSTVDPRANATSRVLTQEELQTLPGSQGDPLRGLQNLPSVARSPGRLGLLVLRGAAPGESRVFLGGHAIPRAFHVLSLSSVFPTDVLEVLRFVPGNFDAAYGNATGGVVVIEPRKGRRTGYHGFGELDLSGASALVEGPVGRGSFVLAAQRAWIDGVLLAVGKVIERVSGDRQAFLLPSYFDYQGLFDHPLRSGASVGVRIFGAGDQMRSSPAVEDATGRAFRFRSDFHRVDVVFRSARRGWRFAWIPSFRFVSGRVRVEPSGAERVRRDFVLASRAEVRRRLTRRLALVAGSDVEVDVFQTLDRRVDGFEAAPMLTETAGHGVNTSVAAYFTAELDFGRWHLRPATRLNAFTARSQLAHSFDPRLSLHVDLAPRWRLHGGVGRYSQPRTLSEVERVDLFGQGGALEDGSVFLPAIFSRFDPEIELTPRDAALGVRQAWQASLGARFEPRRDYLLELTGFARLQDDGVPVRFQGSTVAFTSSSETAGLEVLARKRLTEKLYGWVAYTLMWSQATLTPTAGRASRLPSDFDQRHNLVLVASYALPRQWRIGGSFRLVSGYPFTPIIGSIASAGSFVPIIGRTNSERLGLFHQLDLRIDKSWVLDRASVRAYLDIQNVYNRVNPEAAIYSADFRRRADVVGVPIFPTLGVRVDY